MKQIMVFLLTAILLLSMTACTIKSLDTDQTSVRIPGDNFHDAPKLILNGEVLDVYTSHYSITEEYALIPLGAFLSSIGAEYADSSLNEYGVQCYSFKGKRYIVAAYMHLFMLEDDYKKFLTYLDENGMELSKETTEDRGLLPKTESKLPRDTDEAFPYQSGIFVDHISLVNAFAESGVAISIEFDYVGRTITVTLP